MRLKTLLSAAAVATALAMPFAPAHAATISGSIAFADGLSTFNNTTDIVSQLLAIDDDAATVETASSCVGAFCPNLPPGAFAFDFTLGVPNQNIYTYAGYTFQIQAFGPIVRTALSCFGTGCGDSLDFLASGVVFGNGITPTTFTLNFGAEGLCTRLDQQQNACDPATATASWSSQVVASGRPGFLVPEPQTAALLGLGLVALALTRRRRS